MIVVVVVVVLVVRVAAVTVCAYLFLWPLDFEFGWCSHILKKLFRV